MAALCKRLSFMKSFLGDDFKQCMCLGLEKAGKTHFVYRLLLGTDQKLDPLIKGMREKTKEKMTGMGGEVEHEDNESFFAGYLYEEFQMLNNCGIWDVPGTPAMRQMWKYIYQTIQIHGVFYVIDGRDTGADLVDEADQKRMEAKRRLSNRLLNMLMNEEELRRGFFAVIINQQEGAALPGQKKPAPGEPANEQAESPLNWWETELGIDTLPEFVAWRVRLFIINVDKIDGEHDPKFSKVIDFAKEVLCDPRSFNMKLR